MPLHIENIAIVKVDDPDPDLSYLEGDRCETDDERAQDAARLADYGDGWTCVGVVARATITASGVRQTITSAGLWGIESDSDDDYFRGIGREELDALAAILADMGIHEAQFTAVDAEFFP